MSRRFVEILSRNGNPLVLDLDTIQLDEKTRADGTKAIPGTIATNTGFRMTLPTPEQFSRNTVVYSEPRPDLAAERKAELLSIVEGILGEEVEETVEEAEVEEPQVAPPVRKATIVAKKR